MAMPRTPSMSLISEITEQTDVFRNKLLGMMVKENQMFEHMILNQSWLVLRKQEIVSKGGYIIPLFDQEEPK